MRRERGKGFFYRSYNFVTKDPVIDAVRTLVQREGISNADLSKISSVSTTTLHNWFDGETRRPQFATVAAVTSALGYKPKFVKAKKVDFAREVVKATEEIAQMKERIERRAARGK